MRIQLSDHFTTGKLLRFVAPSIVMMIFTSVYGVVDGLFVSNFVGKTAFAAVNLIFPLLMILGALGFMIGTGGSALVARTLGEGDSGRAQRYFSMLVYVTIGGGIVFSVLGLLFLRPIAVLLGAQGAMLEDCVVYGGILLAGQTMFMLQNVFQSFLITAEKPHFGLGVTVAAGLTNIILDFLFIAVFRWGVAGAAIATISSQLLSAILVVRALMKTDDMYKLEWNKVRIDRRMLQRIVRIGIPAGMQSVMYNISNVIIQAGVNTLGTDNVTAWATYGKVDGLYWMMINALGISVTTFVGQNYGAGRMDRVRKGAGACMMIGVVLTASVGVLLYNGGYLLVELFTTDQQVQAISMDLLHFMVPTFITYIAIEILSGTLRGVGDAWVPLVLTGIGVCAVRVLWIMFVLPKYHTIIGAAFCYPLTWSLTTIAFVVYYYFFSSLRRWEIKPLFKKNRCV